ncbi:LysR family transcriptional regulator [Ruegeria atlantica]|uniref:LysR family transcriptional regulator n=1 Tax=Ruegeria atlantica TaxID=81569 RepID=UPI00249583A0|nr:LysR family transcriptional regulator [Ruegeria atlantica]
MQSTNWDDLRYFLALFRGGKLKAAAQATGVNETTVARRVKALESDLGLSLFLSSAAGRYEPTDAALDILSYAETMESANRALQLRADRTADHVSGVVRITSVPVIINRVLVPQIDVIGQLHPQLTIELFPSSDNLDLSRREADLALRFARPYEGGFRIKAQKLGELQFGVYVDRKISADDAENLGWINYDDANASLPQAKWLEKTISASSTRRANIRVADVETALEATANGLGKTLLPSLIADGDKRLRALLLDDQTNPVARDVWLLSHVDQTGRASILAAKKWLVDIKWSGLD